MICFGYLTDRVPMYVFNVRRQVLPVVSSAGSASSAALLSIILAVLFSCLKNSTCGDVTDYFLSFK